MHRDITKFLTSIFLLAIVTSSCKQPQVDTDKISTKVVKQKINPDSLRHQLNENIHFISDSLLKRRGFYLTTYLQKYQPDTCGIIVYSYKELKESFEGFKNIGDINNNNVTDTVFVIQPFNYCDDGYSYSFFDTSLPRLITDSYCCHPDNLFSIGDIDEDGISEICIFYSSCVSRFKSLIAYSLKKGQWKQVGRCTFDINVMKPDKEKRVRKISKGKFEMLEIIISDFKKKPVGDRQWRLFTL